MAYDILDLFDSGRMVTVCAPMVRYSKLPFRSLVRRYECNLCFTPMILAESFIKSPSARNIEFSTNSGDKPLIVQFAANNAYEFAMAAEMVAVSSNGVDLNCGCPQRWAMKEGYGADLLYKPDLLRDIVLQVRNRISLPYTVSVKIRILDDIRKSVDLCQMLESTGISFITIHSRTPEQRSQPISMDALRLIRDSVRIPLIANGDVKNLEDAVKLYEETGCEGVMAARGILANPALFAGHPTTPLDCVKQWVEIALDYEVPFQAFHHHLQFMMEKILRKKERVFFSSLKTIESILTFLAEHCDLHFSKNEGNLRNMVKECESVNLKELPLTMTQKKSNPVNNCEEFMEDLCISFQ
ncbi:tRNA-dihydrouridine(20a/20b) synthase [NAD(P)+]-like [Anabrus simplex]|uniref:tRNA-dihydrouridine(20a/20b) synthase [NAD(P)+]-like n=1 Tax=Anabrus simplex TaxID=316456 RepID=UPI0034DD153F